jgi:hypothetical protein
MRIDNLLKELSELANKKGNIELDLYMTQDKKYLVVSEIKNIENFKMCEVLKFIKIAEDDLPSESGELPKPQRRRNRWAYQR